MSHFWRKKLADPETKAIYAEWRKKLKDSGFVDIETTYPDGSPGLLKGDQGSDGTPAEIHSAAEVSQDMADYYAEAIGLARVADMHPKVSPFEALLWRLHADGWSYDRCAKRLRRPASTLRDRLNALRTKLRRLAKEVGPWVD